MEIIYMIPAVAAHHSWTIRHLDVQTTFLNMILHYEVYMHQPLGFVVIGWEWEVCPLKSALYGLSQRPRACYHQIDEALQDKSLKCSHANLKLYIQQQSGEIVLPILYVDDLFLTSNNFWVLEELAKSLMADFAITYYGPIIKYLGVNFVHHSRNLLLHQESYTLSILDKFYFLECRPSFISLNEGVMLRCEIRTTSVDSTLYKRIVGKLLYLARTRHDIAFAINQTSRYMHVPQELSLAVVKVILHYLKRYPSYGIFWVNGEDDHLQIYSDANYVTDLDEHISTSVYLFTLGSSPVSWNSKKHIFTGTPRNIFLLLIRMANSNIVL